MITNWKSYPHDAEKDLKINENLNLNLEQNVVLTDSSLLVIVIFMFDHFVGLALKGLTTKSSYFFSRTPQKTQQGYSSSQVNCAFTFSNLLDITS